LARTAIPPGASPASCSNQFFAGLFNLVFPANLNIVSPVRTVHTGDNSSCVPEHGNEARKEDGREEKDEPAAKFGGRSLGRGAAWDSEHGK
jgi:hypothetical protein